jgi:NitT/TauT family transport system ATP-binding protein/taurine transport system ATP-binding protein
MSVRDNVALGLRLRGVATRERRAAADTELAKVGLEDFGGAPPYELSGGMQQRAQIARVLVTDPAVMLLDEPFGALDALTRERLQDQLHGLFRESQRSAVFITHSIEEAVYLGTRVVVMSPRPGRIVADLAVPFADAPHDRSLRASPEFVALREEVAALVLDAHAEAAEPAPHGGAAPA